MEEESFEVEEENFEGSAILQNYNSWSNQKKYDKDFIEMNRNNVNPLRYQFICDNLPENKKARLNELMQEIENQILNNGEIKNAPIEISNPYGINEQNLEKLKEIDEKLENFKMENEEKKEENISLEKVNDALYVNFYFN